MAITISQSDSVIELYTAYFNRAADKSGFVFWKNSFEIYLAQETIASPTKGEVQRSAVALTKIVEDMATSVEYKALYPESQDNTTFVTTIYTNLLGRDFDDEGLAFWVGHLDTGNLSSAQTIINMIAGAKANRTEQGLKDKALIVNKTTVSKYFAEVLELEDVAEAKIVFDLVSDTLDSVNVAEASLDDVKASTGGERFILNSSLDGDDVAGTTQTDVYTAKLDTLSSADSLSDPSKIDFDVLNIAVSDYNSSIAPKIKSIETFNIKGGSSVGLNLANVSGVTKIMLATETGPNATLENVSKSSVKSIIAGENVAYLTVKARDTFNEDFDGNVNINAGDAATVEIEGSTIKSVFTVDLPTDVSKVNWKPGSGIDTLTLNFNGGSTGTSLSVKADALTATQASNDAVIANIGSTAATTIDTKLSDVLKINAVTADLNLSVGSGLVGDLVYLGDQVINFSGNARAFHLAQNTDQNSADVFFNMTSFTDGRNDGSKLDTLDGVQFTGSGTTAIATAAPATAVSDFYVDISGAGFKLVDINTVVHGTLKAKDVKLSADVTEKGLTTLVSSNIELVTDLAKELKLGKASTTLNNTESASTIEILTQSAHVNSVVNTLNVKGDQDLIIKSWGNIAGDLLDASALTGDLILEKISTPTTNSFTFKGGAGDDKVMAASILSDILSGGAGNDTLTGGKGADILTGDAGNDIFVVDAGDSLAAAPDVIRDFTNNEDKIDFSSSLTIPELPTAIADGLSKALTEAKNNVIYAKAYEAIVAYENTTNLALKTSLEAAITAVDTITVSSPSGTSGGATNPTDIIDQDIYNTLDTNSKVVTEFDTVALKSVNDTLASNLNSENIAFNTTPTTTGTADRSADIVKTGNLTTAINKFAAFTTIETTLKTETDAAEAILATLPDVVDTSTAANGIYDTNTADNMTALKTALNAAVTTADLSDAAVTAATLQAVVTALPADPKLKTSISDKGLVTFDKAVTDLGLATATASGKVFEAEAALAFTNSTINDAGIITVGTAKAGQAIVFTHEDDSYVFISDEVAGVGDNDILIEITGVTAKGLTLDATNGDIIAFV